MPTDEGPSPYEVMAALVASLREELADALARPGPAAILLPQRSKPDRRLRRSGMTW